MIEIIKYVTENNYDYEAVGCGIGIGVLLFFICSMLNVLIELMWELIDYLHNKRGSARCKSKQMHNDK